MVKSDFIAGFVKADFHFVTHMSMRALVFGHE